MSKARPRQKAQDDPGALLMAALGRYLKSLSFVQNLHNQLVSDWERTRHGKKSSIDATKITKEKKAFLATGIKQWDKIEGLLSRPVATPYIAFKANTTGGVGGLFEKMFHYFQFKREDFLAHYHQRSNVESTVMMIKSKFGDSLRSKSDVAMRNETLAKVLCHNICCLISAMYELGIQPQLGLVA